MLEDFVKNDIILIKFTNVGINAIKVGINVIKINVILNIISYNYIDVITKMERISREKKIS